MLRGCLGDASSAAAAWSSSASLALGRRGASRQAGAMAAEPPSATKAPSAQRCPCANPGNPVFSCMLDPKTLPSTLPGEGGRPPAQAQLLLYRTTSSDYGRLAPEPHAAPCRFCPRENTFTNFLLICGRRPSGGINTGVERGRVIDHKELVNVL